MAWKDVMKKAEKEIIGYDVVYVQDGETKTKPFRNLKKLPTRYGGEMPDVMPAKRFANSGVSVMYINNIYSDGSSEVRGRSD